MIDEMERGVQREFPSSTRIYVPPHEDAGVNSELGGGSTDMRRLALVLLVIAAALELFAWWGLGTQSGARTFDEMDGLMPFFSAILGGGLAAVSAPIWLIARRRPPAARAD